jgi:hypothetical protein
MTNILEKSSWIKDNGGTQVKHPGWNGDEVSLYSPYGMKKRTAIIATLMTSESKVTMVAETTTVTTRTTSKLDRHSNASNRVSHSFMFFAICSAQLSCRSLSQVLMFRVAVLEPSSNTTLSQTCSPKCVTPTRACCLSYQGQLVEHWTHVIQVSLSCKIIPSAIASCDEEQSLC